MNWFFLSINNQAKGLSNIHLTGTVNIWRKKNHQHHLHHSKVQSYSNRFEEVMIFVFHQ